jgi:hypothetical protein
MIVEENEMLGERAAWLPLRPPTPNILGAEPDN